MRIELTTSCMPCSFGPYAGVRCLPSRPEAMSPASARVRPRSQQVVVSGSPLGSPGSRRIGLGFPKDLGHRPLLDAGGDARCQTGVVARRIVTVEVDERLFDAARAAAERAGVPEDELYERALRDVLARDFAQLMAEIAADQSARGLTVADDEGLALASRSFGRREASGATPRSARRPGRGRFRVRGDHPGWRREPDRGGGDRGSLRLPAVPAAAGRGRGRAHSPEDRRASVCGPARALPHRCARRGTGGRRPRWVSRTDQGSQRRLPAGVGVAAFRRAARHWRQRPSFSCRSTRGSGTSPVVPRLARCPRDLIKPGRPRTACPNWPKDVVCRHASRWQRRQEQVWEVVARASLGLLVLGACEVPYLNGSRRRIGRRRRTRHGRRRHA